MATPENTFIASVHRHIQCYAEKMHNPYRGGTPDVWYSGKGKDLWAEYKFIVVPKRDSTVVVPDLSELQKEWLRNRKSEGRNVAVVVGCKEGAVFLHTPQIWETGLPASKFRAAIISRRQAAELISTFVNSS